MAKGFNKFVAAGAAAVLAVSAVAPAVSAAGDHPFTDVGPRYDEAVSYLYNYEIVSGKTPTSFGTHQNLTRGDAAVILANALGLDTVNAEDAGFTDLFPRVEGAVNALAEAGIAAGITSTKFGPSEPLSRGAMARFLVTAYGLEDFAAETPFTDVGGVFESSIEALYGAGITAGKTETQYGTHQNITRGDFANLLYNTILFTDEYYYFVTVDSVKLTGSTSFEAVLAETVPEELTAQEVAEILYMEAELTDGSFVGLTPLNASLSADRMTLTVEHEDLAGKEGVLYVEDQEIPFDYAAPVAGAGSVTLEGVAAPVAFNFAGGTTASVDIDLTDGALVNLNGIQIEVKDTFAANSKVDIILKDTDVPQVAPGIGLTWGTLTYVDGEWKLTDSPNYDSIPAGSYTLKADFTDAADNTTTLTLDIKVQ